MPEQAQALLFLPCDCRGRRLPEMGTRSRRVFNQAIERGHVRKALQRQEVRDPFRLLLLQKFAQVAGRDPCDLDTNGVQEGQVVGGFLSPAEQVVTVSTAS